MPSSFKFTMGALLNTYLKTTKETIVQTLHGFSVGDVIRHNGTSYVKAQANTLENSYAVGIVENVIDNDTFTVIYSGRISSLSGLTSGAIYYLSPTTAGALTTTEPTDLDTVSKPIFIATSSTSGIVINSCGIMNQDVVLNPFQLKNMIINPDFKIWQRGTSFTSDGYTADRWYASRGTGGTPAFTVSRQSFTLGQTDVPEEPEFYLRFNQTAQATSTVPFIEQRIESVRTFAGQQITISGWLKAAASTTVAVDIIQNFGTGGSPSSSVTTSVGSWNITTSWQRFSATVTVPSISGKTLGTNNNDYLAVRFKFPLSSTFTVDMANLQVEKGSSVTAFEKRIKHFEMALCSRYFWKIEISSGDYFVGYAGGGFTYHLVAFTTYENVLRTLRSMQPVVSLSPSTSSWRYYNAGWQTVTGINFALYKQVLVFQVVCDAVPSTGSLRFINPVANGYFQVDAEL